MFIDASAIVAILAAEKDAATLLAKIETSAKRHVSGLAAFEATVSIARILADLNGLKEKPIPRELISLAQAKVHGEMALDAAKAFGKFSGHKARLNFGDCFAYACAANLGAPLLFKGNDFSHTDVRSA